MKDKILYVHPYNNYTGSTKVISDIISSKYSDLNDITVITETSQPGFLSGLNLNLINVPIIKYKSRAVPILSQIVWVIIGFFKVLYYCGNYDCVYINTILPGFAAFAARLRGKKIIYHIHEKWSKPTYKSLFGEFALKHVNAHHIFVSKYLQEQYPYIYSEDDEICYNKISKEYVKNVELVPLQQHKRNNIIMLASLNSWKGIDKFIDVAANMPNYNFLLIISSKKEMIDDYFKGNLSSNLTILDRQSNIHPYLKESDIMLNLTDPTRKVETFGMTIIEGMAYGLPAIVPNVGGPAEIIKDGFNGYCIDVTSTGEIIRTILKCSSFDNYSTLYHGALTSIQKFQ